MQNFVDRELIRISGMEEVDPEAVREHAMHNHVGGQLGEGAEDTGVEGGAENKDAAQSKESVQEAQMKKEEEEFAKLEHAFLVELGVIQEDEESETK